MGKDTKLDDPVKKMKKKLKKVCCCSCIWFWLGVLFIIIAIILLVYFGSDLSGQSDSQWRKNVAYTGIAFIVIGFIITAVGVAIAVGLCIAYRRHQKRGHSTFTPPTFPYGQAPYPQQKPWPQQEGGGVVNPGGVVANPDGGVVNPSAPQQEGIPLSNANDIKIEIEENKRY